jgi:hypothetical protein
LILTEKPTVRADSSTSPEHRHAGDRGGGPSTCSRTWSGSAIEPALIKRPRRSSTNALNSDEKLSVEISSLGIMPVAGTNSSGGSLSVKVSPAIP